MENEDALTCKCTTRPANRGRLANWLPSEIFKNIC